MAALRIYHNLIRFTSLAIRRRCTRFTIKRTEITFMDVKITAYFAGFTICILRRFTTKTEKSRGTALIIRQK
jgi:hypothetical protein